MCQKWNKSQCLSRSVSAGTGVNGFSLLAFVIRGTHVDCSQPSVFKNFISSSNTGIHVESRGNWMPVQNGLYWVEVWICVMWLNLSPPTQAWYSLLAFSFVCINREAGNSLAHGQLVIQILRRLSSQGIRNHMHNTC